MVEEQTIFHKIIDKKIPSEKVYEDDDIYAFKDINPSAPFHCLVIPKVMNGLNSLASANEGHVELLGKMMVAISKIAKEQKLEKGFRTVFNTGEEGGQSVNYIHAHILAGRELKWPPG